MVTITVLVIVKDRDTADQILQDVVGLTAPGFLEETMTICPNCGHVLQRGGTDELPPVYCDYCGLGWPRLYPAVTPPVIYIRSDHAQECHS